MPADAPAADRVALLKAAQRLAEVPAGPQLGAALAAMGKDLDAMSPVGLTYVLQARARQANHERGEVIADIGRILLCRWPGRVAIGSTLDEFAADEVRAALCLTRQSARRLCELAWDLHRRLPEVLAAMRSGELDQPRAQVFSTWTAGLTREHTDAVVAELLPAAAELTTGELAEAIARLAIALDPEWIRRRYQRALHGRRVTGTRNPDGTATLTGHDLPFDQVAAACARLDALARAAKAAGHPDRLDHLRADLLVGMLAGAYTAMTDQQIITTLLAKAAPHTGPTQDGPAGNDDGPHDDPPDQGTNNPDHDRPENDGPHDDGPHDDEPDDDEPHDDEPDDDEPDDDEPDDDEPRGGGSAGDGRTSDPDDHDCGHGPDGDSDPGDGDGSRDGEPAGPSTVGRRGGLRLWASLLSVMGLEQGPADLLGWGPVHAELAAELAASIRSWWLVLAEPDSDTPTAIVALRRRPAPPGGPRHHGEVWLCADAATLQLLDLFDRAGQIDPGWSAVLAEIHRRLATARHGPPNGDPTARLPGQALRRWINLRERRCVFPGCRAPAHRSDADHTIPHARGGATLDTGLLPNCRHDHRARHEGGWLLQVTAAGQITWTSPLGRTYRRRPPPHLDDPPLPRSGAVDERDPEPDIEDPHPDWDPEACLRGQPPPPQPPSPQPRPWSLADYLFPTTTPSPDDEPPPF